MYLRNDGHTYYRNGAQCRSRGAFLILMEDVNAPIPGPTIVRAIVRKVALRQLGHWVMGKTRIGKKWYTLSGSYGSDGLLLQVDTDAFNKGIPLPQELYNAWSKGEGWNSAGSEAPAMRQWALDTFKI